MGEVGFVTCTTEFQHYAKSTGVPVLLIGHITKDGTLAGPKVMEHIVDAVLQFEGDRNYGYRILRALKNRFGSTAEIGIFEMLGSGLREVPNPSEFLLSQRDETLSGVSIYDPLAYGDTPAAVLDDFLPGETRLVFVQYTVNEDDVAQR